jgi:predicted nuclease of predicted toxin-antitoxin system
LIASVRFLIDADLPRSTKPLLERFGHEAIDVRDVGLRSAKDLVIARYARDHRACLLTGDFGFADIRNYPPESYYGIIVLELPRDATAAFILHLIEEILRQNEVLARLPRKLAIVEAGRIRLRPA